MSLWYAALAAMLGAGWMAVRYQRKKRFLATPIALRLRDWKHYGERYTTLTLESCSGKALPSWTPGSHIVVHVDGPHGPYRRAYSLMGGDGSGWP